MKIRKGKGKKKVAIVPSLIPNLKGYYLYEDISFLRARGLIEFYDYVPIAKELKAQLPLEDANKKVSEAKILITEEGEAVIDSNKLRFIDIPIVKWITLFLAIIGGLRVIIEFIIYLFCSGNSP